MHNHTATYRLACQFSAFAEVFFWHHKDFTSRRKARMRPKKKQGPQSASDFSGLGQL